MRRIVALCLALSTLAAAALACGRAGPPVRSRPATAPAPAPATPTPGAPDPSEESEEKTP